MEIKSKNYSTPLNLSSAAGHVKDLSFAQGWSTHFRDALIQSAAQIRSAQSDVPRPFPVFCLATRCLPWIQEGNTLSLIFCTGMMPQLKQVSPSQGLMQPHGNSLFHHLSDESELPGFFTLPILLKLADSQRWKHDTDTVVGSLLFLSHRHVEKREMGLAVSWCCQRVNQMLSLGQPWQSLWWVWDDSSGHGSLLASNTSLLRI